MLIHIFLLEFVNECRVESLGLLTRLFNLFRNWLFYILNSKLWRFQFVYILCSILFFNFYSYGYLGGFLKPWFVFLLAAKSFENFTWKKKAFEMQPRPKSCLWLSNIIYMFSGNNIILILFWRNRTNITHSKSNLWNHSIHLYLYPYNFY